MAYYRVNLYQTLDVEAENEEEAEKIAIETANREKLEFDHAFENAEVQSMLCENCNREIDENENRCERCKNL